LAIQIKTVALDLIVWYTSRNESLTAAHQAALTAEMQSASAQSRAEYGDSTRRSQRRVKQIAVAALTSTNVETDDEREQKLEDEINDLEDMYNELLKMEETFRDTHRVSGSDAQRDDAGCGPVERSITEALGQKKITMQRYWNGTLVGNHCRIAIREHVFIIDFICNVIRTQHGQEKSDAFKEKHLPVWTLLNDIHGIMRSIEAQNDSAIDILEEKCPELANVWREKFEPHDGVTPKLHIIEHHVVPFIREHRSLGRFGEDGIESLHPYSNRARALVASMQSATTRHAAMELHVRIQQLAPDLGEHSSRKSTRSGRLAAWRRGLDRALAPK
jgi:hypothetical protein